MASTINASNSTTSGLIYSADNSGTLQLQTNGNAALTIDTNQNIVTSPADAKLFVINDISQKTIFSVKEKPFDLETFFVF